MVCLTNKSRVTVLVALLALLQVFIFPGVNGLELRGLLRRRRQLEEDSEDDNDRRDDDDDDDDDGITPNPFMLRLIITIKDGRRDDFLTNQQALTQIMAEDHPGVLTYHVDYPEGQDYSEWTEIYANDETFAAHLSNSRAQLPLGGTIDAASSITCRAWGNPNANSRAILAGFGCVYQTTGVNSFVLNPIADIESPV